MKSCIVIFLVLASLSVHAQVVKPADHSKVDSMMKHDREVAAAKKAAEKATTTQVMNPTDEYTITLNLEQWAQLLQALELSEASHVQVTAIKNYLIQNAKKTTIAHK